jgi:hypothetical protein
MAVIVTVVFALTVGAVKSPELETVPEVADHVTAVFVLPVTVAVNWRVAPEATVADVGEMLTATPEGPHVPSVRLLLRRFRILPKPRSPVLLALMAEPRPELPTKVLLFTQALVAWVSR